MIRKKLHQFKLKRFYKTLIPSNALCFDIGANIGEKSKLFLHAKAKVIAFEPQKSCIPFLEKIAAKQTDFSFVQTAISEKPEVTIYLSNHSEIATLSTKFKNLYDNEIVQWNAEQVIKGTSINEIIETYGIPYFCKLDVEGYECEILNALKHNIPLVEFEMVGGFIEDTLSTLKHLQGINTSFNYTLSEQPHFVLPEWTDINGISKAISSFNHKKVHANVFIKNLQVHSQ